MFHALPKFLFAFPEIVKANRFKRKVQFQVTPLFTFYHSLISTSVESADVASESALGYGVWQE